jgi:hypothetical protein
MPRSTIFALESPVLNVGYVGVNIGVDVVVNTCLPKLCCRASC